MNRRAPNFQSKILLLLLFQSAQVPRHLATPPTQVAFLDHVVLSVLPGKPLPIGHPRGCVQVPARTVGKQESAAYPFIVQKQIHRRYACVRIGVQRQGESDVSELMAYSTYLFCGSVHVVERVRRIYLTACIEIPDESKSRLSERLEPHGHSSTTLGTLETSYGDFMCKQ